MRFHSFHFLQFFCWHETEWHFCHTREHQQYIICTRQTQKWENETDCLKLNVVCMPSDMKYNRIYLHNYGWLLFPFLFCFAVFASITVKCNFFLFACSAPHTISIHIHHAVNLINFHKITIHRCIIVITRRLDYKYIDAHHQTHKAIQTFIRRFFVCCFTFLLRDSIPSFVDAASLIRYCCCCCCCSEEWEVELIIMMRNKCQMKPNIRKIVNEIKLKNNQTPNNNHTQVHTWLHNERMPQ